MANSAPTITTINAFDATVGTVIDFNIIGGEEIVRSNRLYIYDIATNALICSHLYVSTESLHEVPPKTDTSWTYASGKTSADFTNGNQYYAQIQTYTNTSGTQGASGLSSAKVFWCLVSPNLTITYPVSTINTTSCNVQAYYITNAPAEVSDAAQQYQFTLYTGSGTKLQSSGIISGSGSQVGTSNRYNISYNFNGLLQHNIYYAEVEIVTHNGTVVTTRSNNFIVNITTPTLSKATVINDGCNGYISVTSNLSGSYSSSINRILVKRQDVDDVTHTWLTMYSKDINSASDMNFTYIDFFNQYGKIYQYALVPVIIQRQGGITVEVEGGYTKSAPVKSVFDGVYITDGVGSQRLKAGVGYESVQYNQITGVHTTMSGKYPIVVTNSNVGYHSGTISAMIVPENFYSTNGNVDLSGYAYLMTSEMQKLCNQDGNVLVAKLQAHDLLSRTSMVEQRNILEQFLTNRKPKIIKDWNGNIWLVMFVDNIDISFDNSWGMGMATLSANWVEVGNPTNEVDLQDLGLINV
jgi:hypothetical protein